MKLGTHNVLMLLCMELTTPPDDQYFISTLCNVQVSLVMNPQIIITNSAAFYSLSAHSFGSADYFLSGLVSEFPAAV